MRKFAILMIFVILLTGCEEELIDYVDEQIEDANKIEVVPDEIPEEEGAKLIPAHIEEETDMYIVDVKYPQWDHLDTLNYMVEDVVLEEIEYFKDEMGELANDEYYEDMEDMKSGLYIDYTIYHNEWDYLSIGFNSYTYSEGAAHGNSYTIPFNLDFETFEEIELLDIFVDDGGGWLEAISYMSIQRLTLHLYEGEFVEDDWIEEGAGPDSANFSAWTLTDDSIIFHFDPYQVAAYAAGPQQAEFTFSELYGLLKEPWASKGESL